jgi:hypothetical protein
MVHRIAVALAVTLVWLCQPAPADEGSKAAKIEQLMQLTHAEEMVKQMSGQMRTIVARQVESMGVPAESKAAVLELMGKFSDQIAARMDWQKMKPEYIKLYAEVFAEDEIDGMVAFYKTPAGHAMIEKTPTLLAKSMQIAQRQMAGILPEIQKSIDDLKQKYQNAPKQ